ncbi:MAG: iron complex outermembrane receptor protein [Glaciecola sp.]|jgi:iron complex outermembrane receptor protein|uniref:TonB-dependent receptor n=1 Tax=Congregibacter sp. TaxID=2744308 RepID=UPI0039E70B67
MKQSIPVQTNNSQTLTRPVVQALSAAAGARASLLVALLAMGGATSAQAQAQAGPTETAPALEEIIVSAEFRDTPWLSQPSSSSIMDASQIQERTAIHLENLLQLAPNVNLAGGSSRARFYQIRGVGERSQFVDPLNPSVGLLIDGIDFSGLGSGASLFDIEQVEILRGPQGTLHGANALAGLINMRSAAPESEFAARLQTTIGDYGRRELGVSVTGPLAGDTLLFRVAAFQHRSDGFMDNSFLNRSDNNERDETVLRGRLRWLPSARQSIDITLAHIDMDNGYDAFSLDNTRTTLSDMPGNDRQQSDTAGIHYRWEGDQILTEVMASAATSDTDYSFDEDWSFVGIAPDLEYSSFDRYLRNRDSYSAQLRLSSIEPLITSVGAIDWTAGIYALQDDESLRREYTFLSEDFRSQFKAETVAAYGQLDLALTQNWTLSTGIRLANRSMQYDDSNAISSEPDNNLWGGKIALKYATDELGMLYAAVSRGYRAGGVNAGILAFPADDSDASDTLASLRFFDEELLYNLEIGHKGQFLDGRLQSAVALFYMDRSDQQVRGSIVIPREDGSTAFVDYTDNAAAGYNLGLEWELRAAASDTLEVYFNTGLLRAQFDEYINADGRDLEGREQAHAPSYQFAAGLNWRPSKNWQADLQWEGRDTFYFSDRHDEQSGAYTLLHLRVAYQRENWELAFWGRNLLDEDYFTRGFGSFGNDPRKGYVTEAYRQFADPRQLGLSLELRL